MDRYNKALASFSLSVAYRTASSTTSAVLRVYLLSDLDYVRSRIQKLAQYAWHPVFLPLILLEIRNVEIPRALAKHKEDVSELEAKAGTYKNEYYADTLDFHTLSPTEGRDFDQILNDLLKAKSGIDYLIFKCQTSLDLLDFLDDLQKSLEKADLGQASTSDALWISGNAVIRAKLVQERTWAANSERRGKYVSDRASALMQACYTLMARSDTWLNLQVARASKRDSTDMRSIAVLTLVFLPGTFVATFFSTSFYNFHVIGKDDLVSKYYWIFWVVTVVLTLSVLLIWWAFGVYLDRKEQTSKWTNREKSAKGPSPD